MDFTDPNIFKDLQPILKERVNNKNKEIIRLLDIQDSNSYNSKDEIPDVQNLKMYLDVNGKRMQDGSTNTMIFSAKHIVYYLSQFMSLNPGDVIATGTPPGVGLGMKPPVFLNAGDIMKLGIEGLGEQNQICIQGQ